MEGYKSSATKFTFNSCESTTPAFFAMISTALDLQQATTQWHKLYASLQSHILASLLPPDTVVSATRAAPAPIASRKRKLESSPETGGLVLDSCDPLPFSRLMRLMAAKYQTEEDVPATKRHKAEHEMLYTAPAFDAYGGVLKSVSDDQPLDLSRSPSPDVDVESTTTTASSPSLSPVDAEPRLTAWQPDKVSEFVSRLDGCSEYAPVFARERIDGTCLAALNLHHLTSILGLRTGPAITVLKEVKRMLTAVDESDL